MIYFAFPEIFCITYGENRNKVIQMMHFCVILDFFLELIRKNKISSFNFEQYSYG